MSAIQRRWGLPGDILMPIGLIVGLKGGVSVPSGWATWSTADGNFLKGTDQEGTVGTTGARSAISLSTGSGGGHNSGSDPLVALYGQGGSCTSGCKNPSKSNSTVGDHSGHSVAITYKPPAAQLKLIQATAKKTLPLGAIMFGIAANANQSAFATLDGQGPLAAGSTTGAVGQTASAAATGAQSDSHGHTEAVATDGSGVTSGAFTSGNSAGGGSHTHGASTPTITHNLTRAAVRAFEIINTRKITGLIGMWVGAGVPTGWAIVAELVGKYLYFDPAGAGAATGNNTVTITGTVGSASHSHSFSGSAGSSIVSYIPHNNSVSHSHGYSGSPAYEPERYNIKFIKYVG